MVCGQSNYPKAELTAGAKNLCQEYAELLPWPCAQGCGAIPTPLTHDSWGSGKGSKCMCSLHTRKSCMHLQTANTEGKAQNKGSHAQSWPRGHWGQCRRLSTIQLDMKGAQILPTDWGLWSKQPGLSLTQGCWEWEGFHSICSWHHWQHAGAGRGITTPPCTVNKRGRDTGLSRNRNKQGLTSSYYSHKTLWTCGFAASFVCRATVLVAHRFVHPVQERQWLKASHILAVSAWLDFQTSCKCFSQAEVTKNELGAKSWHIVNVLTYNVCKLLIQSLLRRWWGVETAWALLFSSLFRHINASWCH